MKLIIWGDREIDMMDKANHFDSHKTTIEMTSGIGKRYSQFRLSKSQVVHCKSRVDTAK